MDKVGDQEKLREMLLFFLEEMGATQVELSEGMGVSRPLVIDFLSKKKNIYQLVVKVWSNCVKI